MKNFHPATSDMIAGEYQSALDDLLRFIEAGLKPNPQTR